MPATPPPTITQRARSRRLNRHGRPPARCRGRQPRAHLREVLLGVAQVVDVELRARRLDDAPHALPERGHQAHEAQPGEAAAAVGLEQRDLGVGLEVVVGGEVREVEVRVVHPRVLPVEDPQPRAVVEEVRGQQVVVAGHARAAEHRLDRVGGGPQLGIRGRDRAAALARGALVARGELERRERGRQRRAGVDGAQRRRDLRQARRAAPPAGTGRASMNAVTRHGSRRRGPRARRRSPPRPPTPRARSRGRCRAARCPCPGRRTTQSRPAKRTR